MGGGMKLVKAQVKNYRSIIDSGPFDVERTKTILVGPNEAGKTVLLRALQQINPPDDVPKFEALRDYPRSHYSDIATGRVDPAKTDVAIGYFILDSQRRFRVAQMYAGMLSLAILGYTLNKLFNLLHRVLMSWHWAMMRRTEEG